MATPSSPTNKTSTNETSSAAPTERKDARRGPAPFGFAAVVTVFTAVMMGTTLPTPLYPSYEARFGFGSSTTTQLFAIYAAGVILALVLVGRLSDTIGRRPTLLIGVVLSFLSAAVFVVGSPEWLLPIGRVLSGFSAGVFTATGTVAVLEAASPARRRLAGALATAANIGGLGLGMLMAGLVGGLTPWTLRAPYVAHAALLVVAGLALLLTRETAPADRERFRLQLPRVPSEIRRVFGASALGAVTGFAVCGMFSSIAPNFVGSVLRIHSPVVIGTVTFLLFAASATAQIVLRKLTDRTSVFVGTVALVAGMLVLIAALLAASLPLMIAAAVCAGAGQGLLFVAGMRAITSAAEPEHRTEATTAYFITAYLAISVPAIATGLLTNVAGLTVSGTAFAAVVAVVALIGLTRLGTFASARR